MINFGLKIWSTNTNYIDEINRLYEANVFHYLEIYAVPDTYCEYINYWRQIKIPYVIHAAHFMQGFNLAKAENENNNIRLADEAKKFADSLNADKIIFHPGTDGHLPEAIRQLLLINDPRILVENKPYCTIDEKYTCIGFSPNEIEKIINDTGASFCLDFGHAICAANSQQIEPMLYINQYLNLSPIMYHLTDGMYKSTIDKHFHFGKGNYPVTKLLSLIKDKSFVTVEVQKDSQNNLYDFEKDINYLNKVAL